MSDSRHLLKRDEVPEQGIFIIGAGHFGARAARLLADASRALFAVDRDPDRLSDLAGLPVEVIEADGVRYLIENFDLLSDGNIIVPAIPIHLAFEWLKGYLAGEMEIKKIDVPEATQSMLPNTWPGSEGSLLVSYADFKCPDDCPEPERCTVTGEKRDMPLYERLGRLEIPGFSVHVIRSRQLAPGLGGYEVADLKKAAKRVAEAGERRWLLGTACKCHGILTASEVTPVSG